MEFKFSSNIFLKYLNINNNPDFYKFKNKQILLNFLFIYILMILLTQLVYFN